MVISMHRKEIDQLQSKHEEDLNFQRDELTAFYEAKLEKPIGVDEAATTGGSEDNRLSRKIEE